LFTEGIVSVLGEKRYLFALDFKSNGRKTLFSALVVVERGGLKIPIAAHTAWN